MIKGDEEIEEIKNAAEDRPRTTWKMVSLE
jgi:hypothetical protein